MREGKKGGGLTDPFMNPKRDVELRAAEGGVGRLFLRRGGFRRRRCCAGFVREAFYGTEPCVESLRRIFTGRVLSEGKLLRIVPVEGSVPATTQVGQFIKFKEISSAMMAIPWRVASLSRSCIDCMRKSGAPCCSTEYPWVRRP